MAPGFIDVHSHDDRSLLSNRAMTPKLSQGVTTVITGNCGLSLAPLQSQQPPAPLNLAGGGEWYRFADFAGYLAAVERKPPAINAAPLVGHSTLRVGALDDFTRPAREAEIRVMQEQLRAALKAGAVGFSTGLFYPPNHPAPIAEVVALAEELPAFGGIYTTHMRDEGDQVMASLEETFETAHRARVPVVISHLKCAGPKVWGTGDQVLERVEAARRQQIVGFDVYPYDAASTALLPELIEVSKRVLVTGSKSHPEAAGRELSEIAAEWGCTLQAAAERLRPGGAVYFMMDETDVRRILAHAESMIGSDGIPYDPHPHPRLWGTFPRVLGHYCRELGLFPLEQAVRKMTGLSAQTFALEDRGILRAGAFADIVLFDPAGVRDRATFEAPTTPATGIDQVLVNGEVAWRAGAGTGARAGKILKNKIAAGRTC